MKVVHKSSRISVNILARLLLIALGLTQFIKISLVGGNSEGHVNILNWGCVSPKDNTGN